MALVAKESKKSKSAEGDEKSWTVFARLDPSLRKQVEHYIQSQKYPPPLSRVLERALRLLIEQEGQPQ